MKRLLVALALLMLSMLPGVAQIGPTAGAGDGVSSSNVTLTLGFNVNGAFFPMQGGISAWGQNAVTVQWQTNSPCASQINYGTTANYGQTVSNASLVRQHSLTMTGMTTGTDYHYNVVCLSGSTVLAQSGDRVVSTQGATTLAQLAYPGGHVGQTTDFSAPLNYTSSNTPADAIIQGEFSSTTADNDCKWEFTTNFTGTVGELGDCAYVSFTRFTGLGARFQNVLWQTGVENPIGMSFTSATWMGNISNFRVPQIVAQFGNLSSFWSIDTNNEPFNNATSCYLNAGTYYNVGGCNSWYYPFQALAPYASTTTRLIANQPGWEATTRWGGDYPGPLDWPNQPGDLQLFQGGIERIQQALIAGARIDGVGYEMHVTPEHIFSISDMKYQLWDLRRLGLVPEVTEANVSVNCNSPAGCNSSLVCSICSPGYSLGSMTWGSQYMARIFDTMITVGGVIDFTMWTESPNAVGADEMALYHGNQKTPFYYTFANQLQNLTPAVTFPRVRRLNFVVTPPAPPAITSQSALPVSSAGINFGQYFGTPGLITIPWSEYVYRVNNGNGTYGAVTTFSQTSWTIVAQFYVQTGSTATGTYFQMQDASSNPLVSIARSSGGVHTVTIGAASPITACTDAGTGSWNNITITNQAGTFYVSCNSGAPQSTTATIAAVSTINWLDNSGSETIANDVALTTLDVYEANSIITGTAALEVASTFTNSQSVTSAQVLAYTPTPISGTAPVVTLLSPQPNIASPVTNGSNVTNVSAAFGSSGAVTYSATCGGVACTGTNAITGWAITSQSHANGYSITSAGVLQGGSAASGIGNETDTITITATNSTGISPGVVQTVNAAPYIVASNSGSGSTCTLASPCALSAAQTKAQSATFKTILVRSGTYNLTTGIEATSADNGETWTYYGPDGVNNWIFDFTGMALTSPSTTSPLGTNTQKAIGFWINGATGVTVNGGTFQNFPAIGIAVTAGTSGFSWFPNTGAATNTTITNNMVLNGNGGGPPFNDSNSSFCGFADGNNVYCLFSTEGPGIWASADVSNGSGLSGLVISHNAVEHMMTTGIIIISAHDCPTVTGNFLMDLNIAGNDTGGLYTQFVQPATQCPIFTNNYLRDYKSLSTTYTTYARNVHCIYHDENSANLTDSGNICAGGPADNVFYSGGVPDQAWCLHFGQGAGSSNHLIFKNNICDMGPNPHFLAFVESPTTTVTPLKTIL